MIQKTMLVQLIKEVITENPEILQGKSCTQDALPDTTAKVSGQNGGARSGQYAALEQLAQLARQQGKDEVASYLYLAIEADTLPTGIMDKIKLAAEPFTTTKEELETLAQQLESNLQAPHHAKLVHDIKNRFTNKHCLKRNNYY